MATRVRTIIKIDEEKCNGCGLCVPACAEGALQVIDGKARLVSERYCDGLGACLGECPQDAISFEERRAEEFDEEAAMEHVASQAPPAAATMPAPATSHGCAGDSKHGGFVCPSSRMIDRTAERREPAASAQEVPGELMQWPVKLYLVNPSATYFQDADLLLAADCVPFANGGFHANYLRGRALVTGCPKFDDVQHYADKLTELLRANNIRSITVAQMEVPCCSGMTLLAMQAVAASGKDVPVEVVTIALTGEEKSRSRVS